MLEDAPTFIRWAFGEGEGDLNIHQMALRAAIIYVAALAMVRWGDKRFLGKSTAFDVILGVILGSVVSRAITGQSPFIATVVAGFVLVVLHWLFAKVALGWSGFSAAVKGDTRVLVRDGEIDWAAMRRSDMGRNDLLAALRANGGVEDPGRVKEARLERSGDVSVIQAPREPQILCATLEGDKLNVTIRLT